jgi:hypothetical protein
VGHVHKEQVNDGRGTHETFDYVPLSDPNVVGKLIKNRMSVDASFSHKVFPVGVYEASGGMIFNEPILTTYLSLDQTIACADLTDAQAIVVQ